MRDNVNPLLVPRQDSRPHIICLVREQLFLEGAADRTQSKSELASGSPAQPVHGGGASNLLNPLAKQRGDQMNSGNVNVGEVTAIGLVPKHIDLHEAGFGRGDQWLEQMLGLDGIRWSL